MSQRATVILIPVVALAVMLVASSVELGQAQARRTGRRIVSDGVYTADQALRGRDLYELDCGSCHGEDLSGAREGALAGDYFIRDWSGVKLDSLFDRVKAMPPDEEFSLGDDAYLDILAYMLEVNGFPPGSEDLGTEMLKRILIQGKDGPLPPPNFSLVQVVGCLERGSNKAWVLTDSSQPARTKDPNVSADEDLEDLEFVTLGNHRFRLIYVYPDPRAYEGQKVEVKGFLIRGPDARINVSSLQSLASNCRDRAGLP